MSAQELDFFRKAVASISLETDLLTDDVLDIVKNAILEGLSVPATIERVLQNV